LVWRSNQTPVVCPRHRSREPSLFSSQLFTCSAFFVESSNCSSGAFRMSDTNPGDWAKLKIGRSGNGRGPAQAVNPTQRPSHPQRQWLHALAGCPPCISPGDSPWNSCHSGCSHKSIVLAWSSPIYPPGPAFWTFRSCASPLAKMRMGESGAHAPTKPHRLKSRKTSTPYFFLPPYGQFRAYLASSST
jgi:hypothetical protein